MRVAIIDLGTNSVRFDVHQIGPGKQLRRLHREKIMVRLGTGIFVNGKLDRNAVRRTLHAFKRFQKLSKQLRITKTIAFGTSALREATDRESFLNSIQEQSGIHVRVISGAEEANLIAQGILSGEKRHHRLDGIKGHYALVDIGGGSTEINICRGKEVLFSQSFPLGTARVQQLFLRHSPPSPLEISQARSYIRNALYEVMLPNHWPHANQVFGSSGTVRALERLLRKPSAQKSKKKPAILKKDEISKTVTRMSTMTPTELLGMPRMEPKRVDMILAGALILDECMNVLKSKSATFTEFSLRDGIMEEELRLYQQGASHSHLSLHLNDLYEKAKLFGADEQHLKRTTLVAETLFDRLRSVHKLKPQWKIYLSAAMILRDTGEAINLSKHPDHSYYIVRNSDLPAMDQWEIELLAQLCLHHEGSKNGHHDITFTKSKTKKDAYTKLLALLRIADALDSGAECRVILKSIQVGKKLITIHYSGREVTGLETTNVEKKADFFQSIFGRQIVAVWK